MRNKEVKKVISIFIIFLALVVAVLILVSGGGERTETTLTENYVEDRIFGFWQSVDNEDYSVEFKDSYEMIENLPPTHNNQTSIFKFVGFEEGPNGIVESPTFSEEGVYIEQFLDGSPFYYKVIKITKDDLQLLYLNQPGLLTFVRTEKTINEEN